MTRYVLLIPHMPDVIDAANPEEWNVHLAAMVRGDAEPVIVKLTGDDYAGTCIEPYVLDKHAIIVEMPS